MSQRILGGLGVAIALLPTPVLGEASPAANQPQVNVDLPLLDVPFQPQTGWHYFSMGQSLAVTRTFIDVAHLGLQSGLGLDPHVPGWGGVWRRVIYFLVDTSLLGPLPLGEGWMHEEWHRSVMAHRGISSYNDIYNLKIGSSVTNVSHESDDALTRLKLEHNEDQVRLAEAGMESERSLLINMERDTFFKEGSTYRTMQYVYINMSTLGYLSTCDSREADATTTKENEKEGSSIAKRDFTGLDCTGWIRDLSRPSEPYSARGVHPSGTGINRYTKHSDLTTQEQSYLRYSRDLSFLNLIDLFLVEQEGFHGSGLFGEASAKYNGALRHFLTSFGNDVAADLFYASPALKLEVVLHGYNNRDHWFPGLEANLIDLPVFGQPAWLVSLRSQLWQQPRDFLFRERSSMTGGLLGLRLDYKQGPVNPYLEVRGKTRGWVAGIVNQERSFETIAGLTSVVGR